MAALTGPRRTPRYGQSSVPELLYGPVKANTTLQQGGLVAKQTNGLYVPAAATATLVVVGVAEKEFANTTAVDGKIQAQVRRGAWFFNNSSGGDAITAAHQLQKCYVVDDQTVALTDGSGTRPVAGIILQVTADGVAVEVGNLALSA